MDTTIQAKGCNDFPPTTQNQMGQKMENEIEIAI